jgi:hypothetical protein
LVVTNLNQTKKMSITKDRVYNIISENRDKYKLNFDSKMDLEDVLQLVYDTVKLYTEDCHRCGDHKIDSDYNGEGYMVCSKCYDYLSLDLGEDE